MEIFDQDSVFRAASSFMVYASTRLATNQTSVCANVAPFVADRHRPPYSSGRPGPCLKTSAVARHGKAEDETDQPHKHGDLDTERLPGCIDDNALRPTQAVPDTAAHSPPHI